MTAQTLAATTRRPLSQLIDNERRRHRRRTLLTWLAVGLVPAIGLASYRLLKPRPIPLEARFRTQAVVVRDIQREVHATGHVEAVTTVQIGAEVSGKIASVLVDYNDRVKAGSVLARIDRTALQAQLAQTRANVAAGRAALEQAKTDRDQADRNAQRAARLHAEHVVSDGDYEAAQSTARLAAQRIQAAKAQVEAQQAAYDLARTTRDRTEILSPIDGIVVTRNVDPGQTVASAFQTPVLFTVAADLAKMRVVAAVDEADIGEIKPSQPAYFTVTAYPNRTFEGVVTEVRNSPVVVQDVITYGTVVTVANHDLALKPGMTATVRIHTERAESVLALPNSALHFTPPGEAARDRPGVWLLEAGALRRSDVRAGVTDGEVTEVESSALRPGQRVLTELTPEGRKAYGAQR
jgi:HlyD family secretion protein